MDGLDLLIRITTQNRFDGRIDRSNSRTTSLHWRREVSGDRHVIAAGYAADNQRSDGWILSILWLRHHIGRSISLRRVTSRTGLDRLGVQRRLDELRALKIH